MKLHQLPDTILATFSLLCVTPTLGDYPVIVNNHDIIIEDSTPDENEKTAIAEGVRADTYILYRNTLLKDDNESFQFDTFSQQGSFPSLPFKLEYTGQNGSPRNFVSGSFNQDGTVFTYKSSKFVIPYLSESHRNTFGKIASYVPNHEFDSNNVYVYNEFPWQLNQKDNDTQVWWAKEGKFHYKLEPPLPIEFTKDVNSDNHLPLEVDERLVQGKYELGGAVVCARKENGILTMYRLSCSQNTHPNAIQVFNPDEKLEWDNEKSDMLMLTALKHLRPDLLEHNTGKTENRLFIRTKHYTVKPDMPGTTKALRDWYLLSPFYDPVTQTYRETLSREDFISDLQSGFDSSSPNFDPSVYLKRLVPYTLPVGFWDE